MVPYFVTQMGNQENLELSCDRKLTKIGNFSPFRVSEIVFERKNQILHQKIHKNRWVKLFMTSFPSCFSLGQRSAISHFRGRSFITLQQGGGQRVRGGQIFLITQKTDLRGVKIISPAQKIVLRGGQIIYMIISKLTTPLLKS